MRPLKNPLLRRYWIEFDVTPSNTLPPDASEIEARYAFWARWIRRCGVTAYSLEDALELVHEQLVERKVPLPPIQKVIEDVDVSTLDPGHVLPNIGPPIWRGVWYPNFVLRVPSVTRVSR